MRTVFLDLETTELDPRTEKMLEDRASSAAAS